MNEEEVINELAPSTTGRNMLEIPEDTVPQDTPKPPPLIAAPPIEIMQEPEKPIALTPPPVQPPSEVMGPTEEQAENKYNEELVKLANLGMGKIKQISNTDSLLERREYKREVEEAVNKFEDEQDPKNSLLEVFTRSALEDDDDNLLNDIRGIPTRQSEADLMDNAGTPATDEEQNKLSDLRNIPSSNERKRLSQEIGALSAEVDDIVKGLENKTNVSYVYPAPRGDMIPFPRTVTNNTNVNDKLRVIVENLNNVLDNNNIPEILSPLHARLIDRERQMVLKKIADISTKYKLADNPLIPKEISYREGYDIGDLSSGTIHGINNVFYSVVDYPVHLVKEISDAVDGKGQSTITQSIDKAHKYLDGLIVRNNPTAQVVETAIDMGLAMYTAGQSMAWAAPRAAMVTSQLAEAGKAGQTAATILNTAIPALAGDVAASTAISIASTSKENIVNALHHIGVDKEFAKELAGKPDDPRWTTLYKNIILDAGLGASLLSVFGGAKLTAEGMKKLYVGRLAKAAHEADVVIKANTPPVAEVPTPTTATPEPKPVDLARKAIEDEFVKMDADLRESKNYSPKKNKKFTKDLDDYVNKVLIENEVDAFALEKLQDSYFKQETTLQEIFDFLQDSKNPKYNHLKESLEGIGVSADDRQKAILDHLFRIMFVGVDTPLGKAELEKLSPKFWEYVTEVRQTNYRLDLEVFDELSDEATRDPERIIKLFDYINKNTKRINDGITSEELKRMYAVPEPPIVTEHNATIKEIADNTPKPTPIDTQVPAVGISKQEFNTIRDSIHDLAVHGDEANAPSLIRRLLQNAKSSASVDDINPSVVMQLLNEAEKSETGVKKLLDYLKDPIKNTPPPDIPPAGTTGPEDVTLHSFPGFNTDKIDKAAKYFWERMHRKAPNRAASIEANLRVYQTDKSYPLDVVYGRFDLDTSEEDMLVKFIESEYSKITGTAKTISEITLEEGELLLIRGLTHLDIPKVRASKLDNNAQLLERLKATIFAHTGEVVDIHGLTISKSEAIENINRIVDAADDAKAVISKEIFDGISAKTNTLHTLRKFALASMLGNVANRLLDFGSGIVTSGIRSAEYAAGGNIKESLAVLSHVPKVLVAPFISKDIHKIAARAWRTGSSGITGARSVLDTPEAIAQGKGQVWGKAVETPVKAAMYLDEITKQTVFWDSVHRLVDDFLNRNADVAKHYPVGSGKRARLRFQIMKLLGNEDEGFRALSRGGYIIPPSTADDAERAVIYSRNINIEEIKSAMDSKGRVHIGIGKEVPVIHIPLREIDDKALQNALRATYQHEPQGAIGGITKWAMGKIEEHPSLSLIQFFLRTNANILQHAHNLGPTGAISNPLTFFGYKALGRNATQIQRATRNEIVKAFTSTNPLERQRAIGTWILSTFTTGALSWWFLSMTDEEFEQANPQENQEIGGHISRRLVPAGGIVYDLMYKAAKEIRDNENTDNTAMQVAFDAAWVYTHGILDQTPVVGKFSKALPQQGQEEEINIPFYFEKVLDDIFLAPLSTIVGQGGTAVLGPIGYAAKSYADIESRINFEDKNLYKPIRIPTTGSKMAQKILQGSGAEKSLRGFDDLALSGKFMDNRRLYNALGEPRTKGVSYSPMNKVIRSIPALSDTYELTNGKSVELRDIKYDKDMSLYEKLNDMIANGSPEFGIEPIRVAFDRIYKDSAVTGHKDKMALEAKLRNLVNSYGRKMKQILFIHQGWDNKLQGKGY